MLWGFIDFPLSCKLAVVCASMAKSRAVFFLLCYIELTNGANISSSNCRKFSTLGTGIYSGREKKDFFQWDIFTATSQFGCICS